LNDQYTLRVGNPERWEHFARSHHEFLVRLPRLVELSNRAFNAEPLEVTVRQSHGREQPSRLPLLARPRLSP
jgi:hypothetical protein